jgi:hypothetical protein
VLFLKIPAHQPIRESLEGKGSRYRQWPLLMRSRPNTAACEMRESRPRSFQNFLILTSWSLSPLHHAHTCAHYAPASSKARAQYVLGDGVMCRWVPAGTELLWLERKGSRGFWRLANTCKAAIVLCLLPSTHDISLPEVSRLRVAQSVSRHVLQQFFLYITLRKQKQARGYSRTSKWH